LSQSSDVDQYISSKEFWLRGAEVDLKENADGSVPKDMADEQVQAESCCIRAASNGFAARNANTLALTKTTEKSR
jgi:hypothetical protein